MSLHVCWPTCQCITFKVEVVGRFTLVPKKSAAYIGRKFFHTMVLNRIFSSGIKCSTLCLIKPLSQHCNYLQVKLRYKPVALVYIPPSHSFGVPSEAGDHQGRPPSPSSPGGKAGGFGSIMRFAATSVKQAMTVANQRLDPYAPLPLRCCLMSLSLPWDTLASDLLFKDL